MEISVTALDNSTARVSCGIKLRIILIMAWMRNDNEYQHY